MQFRGHAPACPYRRAAGRCGDTRCSHSIPGGGVNPRSRSYACRQPPYDSTCGGKHGNAVHGG